MTAIEEPAKFTLLETLKVGKIEYNKLSDGLRVELERLVPQEGQVFIRRTESPFIVSDMQHTDASGRPISNRFTARLMGELGIPPELSVQDPFSNRIIRVINYSEIDALGQPKPVEASFAKNNEYLMLDLSNALDRQTLSMLYLNPHFEQTLLKNRNGKPVKYARVDQSALIQNDVDARVSIAEMIVKLKNMDMDQKRLLAQTVGFDPKGNVLGDGYIDGFLQHCIDHKPKELEDGFRILHIIEVENLIRKACEYGLLIYNVGESCFSYNNSKAQVMVYFGKNVENQYRHAALVLLNGDTENEAHLKFLKDLIGKHEETIRKNIQKNIDGVLAPGEIKPVSLEQVAEKYENRMKNRMANSNLVKGKTGELQTETPEDEEDLA